MNLPVHAYHIITGQHFTVKQSLAATPVVTTKLISVNEFALFCLHLK